MISRLLSALPFVPHSKTKLTSFDENHGGEVNTVLSNLTKNPSLKNSDWNVINQKLQCLEEAGVRPEVEINLDWEKRSDLHNRRTPRVLDECELAETDVQLTHPNAPSWLWRYKTSNIRKGYIRKRESQTQRTQGGINVFLVKSKN